MVLRMARENLTHNLKLIHLFYCVVFSVIFSLDDDWAESSSTMVRFADPGFLKSSANAEEYVFIFQDMRTLEAIPSEGKM